MANYRNQEAVLAAMRLLSENGGEMRLSDIISSLSASFPKDNYESERLKGGQIRWESWLSFYSIDAVKAGFIIKQNGLWHLTKEGCDAAKLSLAEFATALKKGYKTWIATNPKDKSSATKDTDEPIESLEIETIQAQASAGIREFINNKNPYEFQDLVAALLRGVGYYTPFISPKGKDGGIDIIAYRDPLGTALPRVKVQVKHYPNNPVSVDVVHSLLGVLAKEGEIGIIVTSGTFTNEAKRASRSSHTPIRLIDIDEFIELWLEYYPTMKEADKQLLPIIPIYFIKP